MNFRKFFMKNKYGVPVPKLKTEKSSDAEYSFKKLIVKKDGKKVCNTERS